MGKVEHDARQHRRRGYLKQAILSTLLVGGVVATAPLSLAVLQVLGNLAPKKYRFNYQMKSTLSRLARSGDIRFVKIGGKTFFELTETGRRSLQIEKQLVAIKAHRKRWDRRWRMVVFDIPEKRKGLRDQFRREMKTLGFFRLQDSVWVFPHDCEDLLTLLKADLRIGKDILYAVVESIENDKHLKEHFGLS